MKLSYQIAAIAALLILTFATPLLGLPNTVPFILSILVLMLSASALGHATEELAGHYNQTIGGLLNAT